MTLHGLEDSASPRALMGHCRESGGIQWPSKPQPPWIPAFADAPWRSAMLRRRMAPQNMQVGLAVGVIRPAFCQLRNIISMRTKEGLAAARASGKRLGQVRLNGKEDEIQRFLDFKVSKASIAKVTGSLKNTGRQFSKA